MNHLASLAKWLSVRLGTTWLWIRIPLQSPNGLSKHLKSHQVIGCDLSKNATLAVIWIILKWCCMVDLILDSNRIILVLYRKFYVFNTIPFQIAYFYFFIQKQNKPVIHNNINSKFSKWISQSFHLYWLLP